MLNVVNGTKVVHPEEQFFVHFLPFRLYPVGSLFGAHGEPAGDVAHKVIWDCVQCITFHEPQQRSNHWGTCGG